jgi:glutamate synthase (NADPH/NADH) large chain
VLPGTDSEKELMDIIQQHVDATGSEKGKRILENWNCERPKFVKIFPIDYRNALAKKS